MSFELKIFMYFIIYCIRVVPDNGNGEVSICINGSHTL